MREEHDEATRHSLRTRHCRCGFSETYEQTRVGRGAERAPHVLLLCQVDVPSFVLACRQSSGAA